MKFDEISKEIVPINPFENTTKLILGLLFRPYFSKHPRVRKKWITTLIEKLDLLSDKGLLRMARGFYSIKLSGKPFREVVAEIQNN